MTRKDLVWTKKENIIRPRVSLWNSSLMVLCYGNSRKNSKRLLAQVQAEQFSTSRQSLNYGPEQGHRCLQHGSCEQYYGKKYFRETLTNVLTRNLIFFSLQERISFTMRFFFCLVLPVPVCTLRKTVRSLLEWPHVSKKMSRQRTKISIMIH